MLLRTMTFLILEVSFGPSKINAFGFLNNLSKRITREDISAVELLPQMATVARLYPGHRVQIRVNSFSDNTGAESGSKKLYTIKFPQWPQCLFVEKLCLLSATFSMKLDIQHIVGKLNDETALSRLSGSEKYLFHFKHLTE